MSNRPHRTTARRLAALLAAITLSALTLAAPGTATAAPTSAGTAASAIGTATATSATLAATHSTVGADGGVICGAASVSLYNWYTGQSTCFVTPTANIDPPFPMTQATNGTQDTWCLYDGPNYTGKTKLSLPPHSTTKVTMSVASATNHC